MAGYGAVLNVAQANGADLVRTDSGGDGGRVAVIDERDVRCDRDRAEIPVSRIEKISIAAGPGFDGLALRDSGRLALSAA